MQFLPLISVIIRTKNSEETLEKCLKSIIRQTQKVKEIIIVDNNSTDDTLKIASKYNCKILYYPKKDSFNYSKALNIGIKHSSSQFLLIISSHCYFVSDNDIYLMSYFFVKHPQACSIMLSRKLLDSNYLQPKSTKDVKWRIIDHHNFVGYSMSNSLTLIRKKDWLTYPFNEQVIRCEDMDWALHFSKKSNAYVLFLSNIYYNYENPYASIKKTLVDYVVVSRNYYPKWRTRKGILNFFRLAFSYLKKSDYHNFFLHINICAILIKDKISPVSIPSGHIKS